MRKQVLLVETDEQTRIAVESALRQDGFEVVSVDSASRAEGILSVSSFDAALIGAGIRDDNGPYAVNWLGSDERSSTPFSVLCPQEVMIPELPEELVVRCPFAPEVIQRKVRELTGEQTAAVSAQDPAQAGGEELFGGSSVGEDFLDQALGLDQLEVNESETMDAGDTTQVGPRKVSESLVGYEAD
ncbi:MAG: response regulator transcription factor, partial [candidate division Zixibacteria bacterium]|nr:response regulator transcription factor [candidate division Zixibacteria bacterium]